MFLVYFEYMGTKIYLRYLLDNMGRLYPIKDFLLHASYPNIYDFICTYINSVYIMKKLNRLQIFPYISWILINFMFEHTVMYLHKTF